MQRLSISTFAARANAWSDIRRRSTASGTAVSSDARTARRRALVVEVVTSTALLTSRRLGRFEWSRPRPVERRERGAPEEIFIVQMICEASRGGGRSAMRGVAGEVLDLSEPNQNFTFTRQ